MLAEAVEVGEFSADHNADGEETPELSALESEESNEEMECFFTTVDLVLLRVGSEATSTGKPAAAPGAGVDAAEDTAEEGFEYEGGKYESTGGRGVYLAGTYSCMTRGRLLYWYGGVGRLAVLMGGSWIRESEVGKGEGDEVEEDMFDD